ncbi:MAG: VIT domain-containing protein [Sedimentisphaerales bacterium]
MKNRMTKKMRLIGVMTILLAVVFISHAWSIDTAEVTPTDGPQVTQGALRAVNEDGEVILEFPLKHTSVYARISGFLAQVEVKQHFHNPHKEKIEAVYVFPLPENSAVNEMIMVVGQRNIYGEIHKRMEARQIYEQARAVGKRTALLEQERPNIFTQSVANIQPGEEIVITIRYVQALKYDRGVYRYVFPMVVGPRFIPGGATGKQGTGWSQDTNTVPDASRITPPVLKPGRRSAHDISLTVKLDAGMSIEDLNSKSHDIELTDEDVGKATVSIMTQDTIPNKDFILEYRVAEDKPRSAYLTHYSQQGGYLLLMIQPSLESVTQNLEPKEIFFVVDCSGSMSGYPIQKVKEAMYHCIQGISPDDTFQIIRFSSNASAFAPKPVPATRLHKEEALDYIQALHGSGGTMMIEGIKACLDYPHAAERQRIVFFMTDGFIGNDDQILAAIKEKVGTTRLFSFGVGSSTNRSLLERMAELGRGTAQYIRQDQDAQPVIKDMLSRISKPYLTDVEINWAGLSVTDVYPNPVPDLYSAQPLILFARYDVAGQGEVTLRGSINGQPYEEKIWISLPNWNTDNGSLASVWAREKIKYLMLEQLGGRMPAIEQEVTNLALEYNLMSQYTSFVAVDEVIPEGSDTTLPMTIAIPVPMPDGVSFTGVFGPPSGYPGDYVNGDGLMLDGKAKFDLALGRQSRGLSLYTMPKSEALSRRTPAFAPSRQAGLSLRMLGTEKLAEMNGSSRYLGDVGARGGAYYARPQALREGLDRSSLFLGEKEERKYLEQGHKALFDKDKDLYNTLSQIHYGQKTDEAKANETLKKLLNSKEGSEIAVGLNLLATLAQQKAKFDEAHTTRAIKLVTEGENEHIRSQALSAVSVIKQPVPLDILRKTAKDKDATVRMLTAHALADKKLDKEARRLIRSLVNDKDHRVAALAIKAGTEARKMNGLVPALEKILLNGDFEKQYFAVLEAGLGLHRLAEADPKLKTKVRKIFIQSLDKDYPAAAGKEKFNLKKAINLIALKTLEGYKGEDAYPGVLKLASDADKDVQTLAVSVLVGYKKAAPYLCQNVLTKESFLDKPQLLATVVQHLRGYEPGDDFYAAARKLLKDKKVSSRSHAVLRAVLAEALFDLGEGKDVQYLISLLRKDSDWKVRRAILARLADMRKEKVLDTAVKALEDPHPVIRQLALAEAIAATAKKDKRANYLDKLSQNPTPAICDEILLAEGLSSDLSLQPLEKLRKILIARGAKLG